MPASPDNQEWETHKPKLWQLWVRDKMEMKDLVCYMRNLGFDATPSQFKARFKTWGFMRHLPNETWKYVESQMRSRKRKADEIDVIISGVYFPPVKVIKATSRNFYTQLERQNNPNPPCPPGVLVSIDPTTRIPPGTLSFDWAPQMPWLQFSQHLKLPDTLFGNKHGSTNQVAATPSNQLDAAHRYLSTVGSNAGASPSQIAMRMQALMPENFQGEHLLWSQALVEGSNIDATTRLAMSHYAYLISNNLLYREEDEDRVILELVDGLNLVKIIGPRSPVLKTLTMTAILPVVFRAAIRESRKDLLTWLLDLGLSPDTIFQKHGDTRSGLVYILIGKCPKTEPRDRLPHYDMEMMKVLLSYGASIDCRILKSATRIRDTRVLALLVQHAIESQGAGFLPVLDWKTLWLEAASNRSLDTEIPTLDYLMGLYKSAFPAGIDPCSLISQPSCLIKAVEKKATALLRVLVKKGADLNCCDEKGNFPLRAIWNHISFSGGFYLGLEELIDTLLELSADLNYQPVRSEGTCSTTALHWATLMNRFSVVELFLRKGADPNTQGSYFCEKSGYRRDYWDQDQSCMSSTETPLESAMKHHYWSCAEALVKNGAVFHGDELLAVVSTADRDFTVSSSLIEALTARGFDLAKTTDLGDTVFDISIRKRFRGLAQTLATFVSPEHDKRDSQRIAASCGWSRSDLDLLRYTEGRCSLSELITTLQEVAPHETGDFILDLLTAHEVLFNGEWLSLHDRCHTYLGGYLAHAEHHLSSFMGELEMVLDQYPDAYSYEAMESILDSVIDTVDRSGRQVRAPDWDLVAYARRIAERSHKKPRTRHQFQGIGFVIRSASATDFRLGCHILDACLPFFNEQYTGILPPPLHPPNVWFDGCESNDPCPQWPVCQKLLRTGRKSPTISGLMMAESCHYSVENIKAHLHCGFNPRKRYLWSPTALQFAVDKGDIELVKFLIGLGVNINAPGQLCDLEGVPDTYRPFVERNGSALQIAVSEGRLDMIHILIEAGADINAPPFGDRGATALQIAAFSGQIGITRWLIELGADVNAPAGRCGGYTALEGAAKEGRIDTVQLLLDHGCEIGEPHRAQFVRAVKQAEEYCHDVVVSLLKKTGGWTPQDENTPFIAWGCSKCDAGLPHGQGKHRDDCRVTTQSVSDTRSEPSCSCESGMLNDNEVPTRHAEADGPSSASQGKQSDMELQLSDQEVDQGMVENYTKAWLERLERNDTVVDITGEDVTEKDLMSTGEDLIAADFTGENPTGVGEDLTGENLIDEYLTYGY